MIFSPMEKEISNSALLFIFNLKYFSISSEYIRMKLYK